MGNIQCLCLKDVAEINFILSIGKAKDTKPLLWMTASHLLPENKVLMDFEEKAGNENEASKIYKNDILIKRISPSFINYIDMDLENIYAYSNLIIVRPNSSVAPKYLAYIIDQNIEKLSTRSSVGAVMPSLGKNELSLLEVPILSQKEQKKIGALWYWGIEKKKHLDRLSEVQHIKDTYMLQKYMMGKMGGN